LAILAFSCRTRQYLSARILSLTVRLWANIVASDLLYTIFLGLFFDCHRRGLVQIAGLRPGYRCVAATIPIAFIGLHIFVAIIQAYISRFCLGLPGHGHGRRALVRICR